MKKEPTAEEFSPSSDSGRAKLNQLCTVDQIEPFYREAKRRGAYKEAQDSLIATWRTLVTSVLPAMSVDVSKMTVGELKGRLPDLLRAHGAKSDVTTSTIQTYQIKGNRMLADFLEHHGGSDAEWFEWKQKLSRKAAAAAAAANSRQANARKQNGNGDVQNQRDEAPTAPAEGMKKHILRLPGGNRNAELHVPDQLRETDVTAIENGFAALMGYLKSQIAVESMT